MHALPLTDQAVVSGASFLATLMVGRWASPSQLGLYSIGVSLLVSSLGIHESLISLPYTIQQHRPLGTPAEHAGRLLTHGGFLSALAIVVLAVTALGLSARGAGPEPVAVTLLLAGVLPLALLWELGRRFALARLRMAEALIPDVAVAAPSLRPGRLLPGSSLYS